MKALPAVTYDGELIFHMGGEEIHLYHPARAHTDGDSLVHFKNANIAHWGDAFVNNWVPVIDVAAGSTLEWLQFIDRGHSARRRKRHDGAGTRCDRESRRCETPAAVFHEHARRTCERRSPRAKRASRRWTRLRCRRMRIFPAARLASG